LLSYSIAQFITFLLENLHPGGVLIEPDRPWWK
jgi:hypothetical protein